MGLASAVKGGERAVIFNRLVGIKENTYGEGTHLMLPWFDRPIIFEVRTRPRQIQSLTGSKGLGWCFPASALVSCF
jgi:prohibitin 2